MSTQTVDRQHRLEELLAQPQEAGVPLAIATYEAVEKAYLAALAATPTAVTAVSYATTTGPR